MTSPGEGSETGGRVGAEEADVDDVGRMFLVLSNEMRRDVLRIVAAQDSPVEVKDIAINLSQSTPVRVENVVPSLREVHIPRLERAGLVSYNRSDNLVELTNRGQSSIQITQLAREAVDDSN